MSDAPDETTIKQRPAPGPAAPAGGVAILLDDDGAIDRVGRWTFGRRRWSTGSWKTTVAGAATILTSLALLALKFHHGTLDAESAMPAIAMILGGGGLTLAKDHNVTGGTKPA